MKGAPTPMKGCPDWTSLVEEPPQSSLQQSCPKECTHNSNTQDCWRMGVKKTEYFEEFVRMKILSLLLKWKPNPTNEENEIPCSQFPTAPDLRLLSQGLLYCLGICSRNLQLIASSLIKQRGWHWVCEFLEPVEGRLYCYFSLCISVAAVVVVEQQELCWKPGDSRALVSLHSLYEEHSWRLSLPFPSF